MTRKKQYIKIVSYILALACVAACASCGKKQAPPAPPTPVNLITVKVQPVLYYDKYPATTQALSQVNLVPQVQGYVTGIFFEEGTNVRQGQKLYEIDGRVYQAAYDQAAANVRVAQGNETQAQQDADRYAYLNSHNAVAKQQYDHAVITLQNAKNDVQAAQQTLKTAQTNLSFSVITAPFSGTIGFSQVKIGNTVVPGQTILNTLSSNDPMAVDFLANEKQLPFFNKLLQGHGQAMDSLFTIIMPDNSLYAEMGKISVIDRAVNAQTGSVRVRLTFPNPKQELRVGMSCVLRVHNQEATPQIVIPGRAVVEQMGEYFVFVAKDTLIQVPDSLEKKASKEQKDSTSHRGPDLHVFQKKVTLGQTLGANVIIKEGIQEGDRVVVDGVQLLHDGSRVAEGKKPQHPAGSSSDSTVARSDSSTIHDRKKK